MEQKQGENKMGVMPVKPLIISVALPIMISMLVQALYNVVDSIFVSRISEDALTAVTLAFPMQNMMIAVGSGTGVGINALLSRSLGEKSFQKADDAANTGIFLAFCSFLVFMFLGIFFASTFIRMQTDHEQIAEYGTTYLRIVMIISVGIFMQMTMERLLQATGKSLYSMISQVTGAVINIIFDPIMIFGLLGFPRMGVAGAAYATVLGQCVACLVGIMLNLKKNTEIHFRISGITHPSLPTIKQIYKVAIPSILMIAIGSVMTFAMNKILIVFSTTATAVFGVYFKLQSFFFMPVIGLNNGVVPVVAYNYGARNKGRIDEALRFAVTLAICIMTLGMLIFELFPEQLLSLFNASGDMLRIGKPALRIIGIHYPIAAVCILLGSVFQALSQSIYSLIVSVGRQLVILVPVAWLLSRLGSVDLIWWSFPIAEVMSLILSLTFFRKVYRETVSVL